MRVDMYVETVLKKCELFNACSLWSREPHIRPRAWLNNFEEFEKPIAALLLDHFIFFDSRATNSMLGSSLRRLAAQIREKRGLEKFNQFVREAIFTPVLGENPNVTDSGGLFCRKVRQLLNLPESRFTTLDKAYEHAKIGKPVIFVDDFIGSGDQMASTWNRTNQKNGSFKDLSDISYVDTTYLALIGTNNGCERLKQDYPVLNLIVTHILDDKQSVFGIPSNPLTPDINEIEKQINCLLDKYHSKLIVPEYFYDKKEKMYGYSELGLLLAFEHSVPDASIPLIWADSSEHWTPLVRRT